METRWEINGKDLRVGLSGKLDTMSAMSLDDKLTELPEEVCNIYFDLDGLEYIASAGLRLLYWAQEYSENRGGKMSVKNVSPEVLDILDMTGFKDYITIE